MSAAKHALRKSMLIKRKALCTSCDLPRHIPHMIQNITELISCGSAVNNWAPVLAGYFPIKHELNILPILEHYFHNCQYSIALPQINSIHDPLTFRHWGDLKESSLVSGRYNIPVPNPSCFNELVPNVLLVPLVAFTDAGTRLGYGGGYYDRTIRTLKQQNRLKMTIGLAYEGQKCEFIPLESQDQSLDAIVTETNVYLTNNTKKYHVVLSNANCLC